VDDWVDLPPVFALYRNEVGSEWQVVARGCWDLSGRCGVRRVMRIPSENGVSRKRRIRNESRPIVTSRARSSRVRPIQLVKTLP
jgi:hypothetical protein